MVRHVLQLTFLAATVTDFFFFFFFSFVGVLTVQDALTRQVKQVSAHTQVNLLPRLRENLTVLKQSDE